MKEAVNELVQVLTEPKFQGKMVVVLAGYAKEMEGLMRVNEGLRSRFSQKIVFESFGVEDSCTILRKLLQKDHLELDTDAEKELPSAMEQLVHRPNFGNGRDILFFLSLTLKTWFFFFFFF